MTRKEFKAKKKKLKNEHAAKIEELNDQFESKREKTILTIIGDTVREARTKKKVTQSELCKAINRSRPSVCNIELGRHSPNIDVLIDTCIFLDIDGERLFSELLKFRKETK